MTSFSEVDIKEFAFLTCAINVCIHNAITKGNYM